MGHLKVRPTLTELLHSAKLVHVEVGVLDLPGLVQVDRDPRVALDPVTGSIVIFRAAIAVLL